jgi:hypothetical protein
MTKSVENLINNCNNNLKINDDKKEEEEEYEYDVPENNKPLNNNSLLLKQQVTTSLSNNELKISITNSKEKINEPNETKKHVSTSFSPTKTATTTRKSNSPTIDSGISSSSLISLNELLNTNSIQEQLKLKIPSNENLNQIETRFLKLIKNLRETCKSLFEIQQKYSTKWREHNNLEKNLLRIKANFLDIKTFLNDFYDLCMIVKNKSLNNNSTNKENYSELCSKLYEFQQKFNSNINILNTLKWDINILASNNKNRNNMNDELDENFLRLNYLIELVQVFNDFNYQYNVFSASNNLPKLNQQTIENDYSDAAIDDGDSEDDIYENDDDEWLKPSQENQVKEELKTSTNFSDQMLIKFYSKHIDDNFNDIKQLHEIINNSLTKNDQESIMMDLTNKLALSGHKLVFICDTLNKNLTNNPLKNSLNTLSNNLCDCLKLYVIRMKACYNSINSNDKSNLLIVDSLTQVFDCSFQLKQLIIKYL